ncbi:MAG: hypothetical protein ACFNVR_09170, partial [Selenomonas noxia]
KMKNIQVFLEISEKSGMLGIEGKCHLRGVVICFTGLCGRLEKEGDSDDFITGEDTTDQSPAPALRER